jgi:hypothetical protein
LNNFGTTHVELFEETMKTFPLLAVCLSLGLAQTVSAQDRDEVKVQAPKSHPKAASAAPRVAPKVAPKAAPNAYRNPAAAAPKVNRWQQSPVHLPAKQAYQQVNPRIRSEADIPRPNRWQQSVTPQQPVASQPNLPADAHFGANQDTPRPLNKAPRAGGAVQPEVNGGNTRGNTGSGNAWRHRNFNNRTWEDACRRHRREHHHRDWWLSHFTRFAIFGTGYYFWDAGYWYPAYGYDPAYNVYEYQEPIAAYGDLEPTQVIASVQTELQRLGYYPYEVDGQMGPATREALANYQQDYGLEVTSAIDEPTLDSLGLL